MNKLRTILTWGLLAAVTHVMGYTITVSPTQIEAGKTTNLIINLNNTETNLTAYQMKLFLPEGVTVQKKANGKYAYTANSDRHDGEFTFTVKDAADGSILITCFSADKDVITGNSGELIRLPIEVASSVTASLQGSLKEIEFSDVNNQAYNISDVNFTLTMEGGETPPVVTDDVTVSVPNVAITAGGSTNLIVNMLTELTNLTAYQMKLFLPEGVTVQRKTNGKYAYTANSDRHDGEFTFTVKDAADGSILITCFSADKDVITDNSGELIRLPIEVASSVTASLQGSLKEIEFSDVNNQAYNISDVNFTLTLEGETSPNITFSDANVKAFCVSNWDSNGDGELSEAEAAAVTSLGEVFKNNTGITSFNELKYFTGLTDIGSYAFYNCSSLISVAIPGSVTSIGEYAFKDCSGLTSVHISDIKAWCEIAFKEYSSNPLYYAQHLFLNGEEIKNLVIPNSVTSIGDHAFRNCSGLTSVTIPNSLTSIGDYGFFNCKGLTSVHISDLEAWCNIAFKSNPLYYAQHLFLNGVEIRDLVTPNSVTSIGKKSFRNCTGLTSVTIHNSVASIDSQAFEGCTGLTDVWCYAVNVPSTESNAFNNSSISSATLHVPAASLGKYKTTEPWSGFGTIVAINGETPDVKKCATPTISYVNGEVTFNCETEDVTFIYDTVIEDKDIKGGIGNKLQFSVTYHISVYAQKEDYYDSDVATATLCWIDAEPKTEGIDEDAVTEVKAVPVLIQTQGGNITIQGAAEGTPIAIYGIDGKEYGSATSEKERTTIATSLQPGSVAVVRIGEKAVKVLVK